MLLNPLRGVEITFSKNVTIDGLTIINPQHYTVFGGQSENITIRNVRSFSRHPWSDGVDMMCCKNVLVEDVFLRNNVIQSYDADHAVSDLHFENVRVNGRKLKILDK